MSVVITALKLSEDEIRAALFPIFVAVFVKKMSCHKISKPDLSSLGALLSLRLRGVVTRTDIDAE